MATKCGCDPIQHAERLEIRHVWTRDVVTTNLETSLRRLRTDHIDVLQFHGGNAAILQQTGLIDLLLQFRQKGMIRFLGASSSLPDLPAMIDLGVFDTFQIPYSCLAPEHYDQLTRAAQTGAGIVVRGGIAQGGPDAVIQRPAMNDLWNQARLNEVLPEGVSRAELILRYTLTHPHCDTTIVGTCNVEHLAENLKSASAGPLPEPLYCEIRQRVASAIKPAVQ